MISRWKIIDTGSHSALRNMELDAELLAGLEKSPAGPILHLYDWIFPSATYGYFIDPCSHLSMKAVESLSLQLARRPTGGGVIFHATDWAFSVLVPAAHPGYSVNTLDNYAYVNNLVIELIKRFIGQKATLGLLAEEPKGDDVHSRYFCMAKPTRYDVMVNGRKVGGGAQRRTRFGFLHQGTISLAFPDDEFLDRVLLPGIGVHEAMRDNTHALLTGVCTPNHIREARCTLAKIFRQMIEEGFCV